MSIYLSSDLHLFHDKDFIYKARGFSSVTEMNTQILTTFCETLTNEDDLYLLGDNLLGGDEKYEEGMYLLSKIPGHIHLVRGNHDTEKRWNGYKYMSNWDVVEMQNAIYLKYSKYHFYLSHFPTLTSNNDDDKPLKQRLINLCGHSHTTDRWADADKGCIYHVEVDAHDLKPVLLDDIIKELKEYYTVEPAPALRFASNEEGQEYKNRRCDKCVWHGTECWGPTLLNGPKCPDGQIYKRDPPDGGYYG